MMSMSSLQTALVLTVGLGGTSALAADDAVVARVNGEPILATEVEAELRLAKVAAEGDGAGRGPLWRAAFEQVIDRQLVLSYLSRAGDAASAKDVDLALAQFENELKAQDLSLDEHCRKVGLTKVELRRSLGWKLSWKRYCDKQLTPANFEKYFNRYRRDFDGTQLRIAQILFKVAEDADEAAINTVKDRAADVRREILAGKMKFEDAAKQHSAAPSGSSGGDIGWIERHRPMPEGFSKIAFALKKGEVSEPLLTSFGVHLITVIEEKPGSRSWREAESELRPAVTLYLFRWIADQQRQTAKMEYVGQAH
jgi:parvulin-like peptidyl-prolyl isomerase